ncbi:MAG: hypothetical protein ABI175_06695 [Polyangiales bacterium]
MSSSIRIIARTTLSAVTPEQLYEGVSGRLESVTALYPRDDDSPRQVLSRLKIERADSQPFGEWHLHYAGGGRPITVERLIGKAWEPERRALFDEVGQGDDPVSVRLRALLSEAKESVVLELTAGDVRGMGWPVAMAAAAALARASDGVIRADDEGWLEPKGKELTPLLSLRG